MHFGTITQGDTWPPLVWLGNQTLLPKYHQKKNKLIKPTLSEIKDSLNEMDHAYKTIQSIIDENFYNQNPNPEDYQKTHLKMSRSEKILQSP